MKLIKRNEGQSYEAAKHFKYWSMRKLDGMRLSVSLSHFLPGGGTEMSSSPKERIYYGLSGTILVEGKKEEYTVGPGDLIYIGPNEERSFTTLGTEPSTILVMITDVSKNEG